MRPVLPIRPIWPDRFRFFRQPAARGHFAAEASRNGGEIDTDGIVNVSARDVESGQKTQTSITLSRGMSDADMAAAKARADNVDVRSR